MNRHQLIFDPLLIVPDLDSLERTVALEALRATECPDHADLLMDRILKASWDPSKGQEAA